MKIINTRTCNRCKALIEARDGAKCQLGYAIEIGKRSLYHGHYLAPVDGKCPKPTTTAKLNQIRKVLDMSEEKPTARKIINVYGAGKASERARNTYARNPSMMENFKTINGI